MTTPKRWVSLIGGRVMFDTAEEMDKYHEDAVKVPFGSKHLDAAVCVPGGSGDEGKRVRTAVVLTHGAGGDMNTAHLVSLARALVTSGFLCLRFTCKGFNLAHRVKAYRAVWDYMKSLERFHIEHIFIGAGGYLKRQQEGRGLKLTLKGSLGSRAAVALARQLSDGAEGAVQGVICLSFPLHPPGQTHAHRQRSEDLRALPEHVPVLFVSGTEDNMCDWVLFDRMLTELKPKTEVFWLKGGSHGLTVKGRSEESVLEEVNLQVVTWITKRGAEIN